MYVSVAKYAALCASCAAFPDRAAATLQQYGVTDETGRVALDEIWQDRFDEDPSLLQSWESLYAHFRGSLQSAR